MKRITAWVLILLLLLSSCLVAFGEGSSNYIYDSNNRQVPAPPAYLHERTFMLSDFQDMEDPEGNKIKDLKAMRAACVKNDKIYITCKTRLIIFSSDFEQLLYTSDKYIGLDGYKANFDSNEGIFVTDTGEYYICEPDRSCILHFSKDNEILRVLDNPGITGVDAGVKYRPTQLVVDEAGRMFVIAKGMYEGIVELDSDGTFIGFYGVNEVKYNLWDLLWRKIATGSQRSKQSLWLPTDFTNICLDADGFKFATVQSSSAAESVMRLNAKGENILRVDGDDPYPSGDLWMNQVTSTGAPVGASEFIAVDTNDFGVYICLDATRNRVFAYNEDGKLLFIFGGKGNRKGYFRGPLDVDFVGENIMVIDSTAETIELFAKTDYGTALMNAVNAQYDYDYLTAEKYWLEALSYNQNLFIAYSGIGRALLRRGEYEKALKYLKLGDDRKYYSKALEKVRNETLKQYLMPAIFILAGLVIVRKLTKRALKHRKERRNAV